MASEREDAEVIQSYYAVPREYDTITSVLGRDLCEAQLAELEKEIDELFEQQIRSMNGKKTQFYEKVRSQPYKYRKRFLCSAWMRGFCFFRSADCLHAHSVDELVYSRDDFSYEAQTHYERVDIKQLAHNLNYIHLYEFARRYNVMDSHFVSDEPATTNLMEEQAESRDMNGTNSGTTSAESNIAVGSRTVVSASSSPSQGSCFTLDQINNDRSVRTIIREHTRTKIFEDFFLLLRRTYDDMFITEGFLVNEFTRIGVGSDALGFGIKSGRISNYLTRHLCYVAKALLPCSVSHYQSFIVVKERSMQLHEYFKEKILKALSIIKEKDEEFNEPNIKAQVKELQGSDVAPSLEVYLVKENMCFFRYFKFYSTTDLQFFQKVLAFVQPKEKKVSSIELPPSSAAVAGEAKEEEDENPLEVDRFRFVIQFDCCSEASEKTQRKNRLLESYLAEQFSTSKKKLCRYWLRGLCIFAKDVCHFSHGIADLQYEKYDENVEDADYVKFANQKPLWKERSYVSLFNEQPELISKGIISRLYTQEDFDEQKELRESAREKMQISAMEEFLDRIWDAYGRSIMLTRSFINREFQRVGFFSIGYTLKNQMIIDILSQRKCFLLTTLLPPLVQPVQVIMPLPSYDAVLRVYGSIILKIYLDTSVELSNYNKY